MEKDVLISPKLWILVADAKQAQIYLPRLVTHRIPMSGNGIHRHMSERQDYELEPVLAKPLCTQSRAEYEAGRNQTGMVFESFSSARHMAEPRVDLRDEIKEHFARQITDYLAQPEQIHAFDRLILVAPPKMLGKIDAALSENIRHRIEHKVAKELTKATPKSLVDHLAIYL